MGAGREMPAWECCPTLPWSSSEVKKYLATRLQCHSTQLDRFGVIENGEPCNNIFLLADDNGISRLAAQIFSLSFADSDDSDTEGGLGNVERVVMRPPGHSGKAKRGHLCFDSSFETGALHFNRCQIETLLKGAVRPSSHQVCMQQRKEE